MSIVDVLPLDLLDSMRTTKNPTKRNNLFERKKKNVTFYKPALQQLKVTSDYLTMLVRASVPPKDTERDGRTARAFTSRKERGQQVGAIIAITREDMENLLISSSRNGNSSRLGWSPGCQCPCHMAAASVSVYPKVASFSTTGGTSQHMITNQSKNRIAVKIKCSDNHLYKVSPVYCFLDPGYTQQLDIARGDGLKKKDKLVLMFLETTAAAEDAKAGSLGGRKLPYGTMSAEVLKDDSRCLKTTEDENVGKADTVECSSPVSSVPDEPTSPNPNSDSSSDRPKLSKQCVIDEEGSNHLSENELQATPTETGTKEHNNRGKQLIRSHAMCGDDDTRLRPPPEGLNKQKLSSKSVSRDSTATFATDYTDASGVDLYAFIISTLHKNPKDRQMVLELEKSLTGFVQDTSKLSLKFGAMSSYNRMLIHRVAAYFGLDHNVDQSGQCVVVNKNEHSRLPEIEFSSLIQGNYYTEGRSTGRFSRRDIHSFEEMRDFSPVSTGAWSSVDAYRKARSFGANNVPYQIPPLYTSPYNQYTPTSQYMLSPRDSYAIAQQRSLDAGIDHSQLEWSDGRNGSVPVFQKAGSFGGVPAYYQQREGYAKVAPPSSVHDDDVTALSETTGSTSGRKAPSSNAYPPPLMSVRVPEPPYDPTMATRYADVMDNNGSQSQGQTATQGPQMQYYSQQPQYYSPPIQSPIYTPTPPLQQQFDGLAQEMAAMSLQQNSSTSSNASYQNTQPIRSTSYFPPQSVPMAMGYNTQMCYPMSTPQMFVPRTMAVYPTQYPPNTVSYGYVYQGQQTYAPYPQQYGENVYACQPYMAPNGAVYYNQPPMSNAGYTPHTHESVPLPPSTTGIQNGHPTLSHSHDHGYGSMTQESLNQSDSIDHCEQTHA